METITPEKQKTDFRPQWKEILFQLERVITRANFVTWFRNTGILDIRDKKMLIGVPNAFTKSWLEDKYQGVILEGAKKCGIEITEIAFQIDDTLSAPNSEIKVDPLKIERATTKATQQIKQRTKNRTLNPRYTYENFVVGDFNRLANAACRAVVENPGYSYNPLFLYGGVGLGKTHLLQATGNAILKKNGRLSVLYTTSETLTNDIVNSIHKRNTKSFKEKYRSVDVLIIDDIQFIAGKERTQEEFFHTFNSLIEENKQIIISSDRPPSDIKALEERLRSRFESGMIADIGVPDFETRLAILRSKCQEKGAIIDPDVLEHICQNATKNVRELEGILTQIIANKDLTGMEPTILSVSKFLEKQNKLIQNTHTESVKPNLTAGDVIHFASEHFDVSTGEITGKSRKREIVIPRQICMYIMKNELSYSYEAIGEKFGGKNHTTVIHAVRKITNELKTDKAILRSLNALKRTLGLI